MKCANPASTGSICCEDFFYGLDTGVPDAASQEIETWFQRMESYIGGRMDSIIRKFLDCKQIEGGDKWVLALLMSMIWMRGVTMRGQIQRMTEDTMKVILEHKYSIQPEKQFDDFDKKMGVTTSPEMRQRLLKKIVNKDYEIKANNAMHLQTFDNITSFANLFCRQYWTVYISNVSSKFVTTDNPLAVRFPKAKGILHGRTLMERAHYFPLTPDIFIVATEPNDAWDNPGIRIKRKTLFKGSEAEVLELNIKMVRQAQQYVFGINKKDLEDMLTVRERHDKFFATPEGKIVKAELDEEYQRTE